jgi:sugar phosphate isomerase/epimerase
VNGPARGWSRRDLLRTIAAGAAAAVWPFPSRPRGIHDLPLGIQLYTVRDLLATDFDGTLAALRRIGYREVEFAGLHGHPPGQVRALLDRLGLRAPGGHVGIPAITDGLDQTIAEARTLGLEYVIVPWIDEDARTATGYRRIAATFNSAGARLRAAGLTLGYHNHWFEFDPLADSPATCGYDLLLDGTDPELVVMELDLYWIRKGGKDALHYFRTHPGRFRLVHVKDMGTDGSMVDVGQGVIPWPTMLPAARQAGVRHFLAEHDNPPDPLAFARATYAYLRTLRF